jgi:hypothetical protein
MTGTPNRGSVCGLVAAALLAGWGITLLFLQLIAGSPHTWDAIAHPEDIDMLWIIIGVVWLIGSLFAWSLCRVASDADDIIDAAVKRPVGADKGRRVPAHLPAPTLETIIANATASLPEHMIVSLSITRGDVDLEVYDSAEGLPVEWTDHHADLRRRLDMAVDIALSWGKAA